MTILSELSDQLASLVSRTATRMVAVDPNGRNAASGIIWRSGLVVTANEAVSEEERFDILLPDGKTSTATLAGRDASSDIALLRVETESFDPLKPAKSVQAGNIAIAVGRSRIGPLSSWGIAKEAGGPWHSSAGSLIDRRMTLDLVLDRRAHGGAVVDTAGDLIGLAAFAPRHQALVIPAETVARVAERLETSGRVARGYLGASFHPVRVKPEKSGLIIVQIDESGPASRAGLMVGDVVAAWEGEAIASVRDLLRKLGPDAVGSNATLDIIRASQPKRVEVAIGERPHK